MIGGSCSHRLCHQFFRIQYTIVNLLLILVLVRRCTLFSLLGAWFLDQNLILRLPCRRSSHVQSYLLMLIFGFGLRLLIFLCLQLCFSFPIDDRLTHSHNHLIDLLVLFCALDSLYLIDHVMSAVNQIVREKLLRLFLFTRGLGLSLMILEDAASRYCLLEHFDFELAF